jgi:hypothetical protein
MAHQNQGPGQKKAPNSEAQNPAKKAPAGTEEPSEADDEDADDEDDEDDEDEDDEDDEDDETVEE